MKVITFLATGFEEVEAIAPIDVLRRAGIGIDILGLEDERIVTSKAGIDIKTPQKWNGNDKGYDAIILPGGPGYAILQKDNRILNFVKKMYEQKKLVAAICAAPVVLYTAGILAGKEFTAHFSVKDLLPKFNVHRSIVKDDNIITAAGAGCALAFGLHIIEYLQDRKSADAVAKDICYPGAWHE